MSKLILPRKDKEGKYYISYSQATSWNDKRSFNLGIEGRLEYMLSYFHKVRFPDQGWAMFGEDAENYVCYKDLTNKEVGELDAINLANLKEGRDLRLVGDSIDSFTEREKEIMDAIEPLGVFQKEIKIDFGDFYVLGYIDDALGDFKKIRDYKTCSENSSSRYYKDDYFQLDLYSMWVKQELGYYPDVLEVCMIERKGNCFGMVERRDVLSVGNKVWYHNRVTTEDRQKYLKDYILRTALEISSYYKTFLELEKLK